MAVALGNWGAPEAVPALAIALDDEEALVRGHAAWALGRIGTEVAPRALAGRAEVEEDAWVREEIEVAASAGVYSGLWISPECDRGAGDVGIAPSSSFSAPALRIPLANRYILM